MQRLTSEERRAITGLSPEELERASGYYSLGRRNHLEPEIAERLADRLMLRDRQRDDRRACIECVRLAPGGACLAAREGKLPGASRQYHPVRVDLRRCDSFRGIAE
ncbi:hypothetical protein [Sphaerotilus sp.]|uniref:hypothetical protein n=1 Tax=Sphaerotilus sp. TaxID=2093942 RepID=UPI002ACDA230|nr:hypothetical protein [Sphaerotilus sp.]MDZ7858653.1 hypothetical protein [Sphaerotilus sp.]